MLKSEVISTTHIDKSKEEILELENFRNKIKDHLALANLLKDSIKESLDRNPDPPIDKLYKLSTDFLLRKSFKSYCALQELLFLGYVQDAAVILRSILENLISTLYINKRDEESRARLFMEYGWVVKKQQIDKIEKLLMKGASHSSVKNNLQRSLPDKSKILPEYNRVKNNYPNEYKWAGISLAQMAEEVGLGLDYELEYWYYSLLTHPSADSSREYAIYDANAGTVKYNLSKLDGHLAPQIFFHSYFYLLILFNLWSRQLQLDNKELLKNLKGRYTPNLYESLF